MDDKLIAAIVANKEDDLKYKKQQIELFFSIHPDETERAEYLRSAYQDRYTEIIVDGVRVGYKPQENGLLMWEGAKKMDLLTYLKNYEPDGLVHFGGGTYCTRAHVFLRLPQASRCATHAVRYLTRRGIDGEILSFCIQTGWL